MGERATTVCLGALPLTRACGATSPACGRGDHVPAGEV